MFEHSMYIDGELVHGCQIVTFGCHERWLDCDRGCKEIGPFDGDAEMVAAAKVHEATHLGEES